MQVLDLFSGIGGFRLGLEMAGHKTVGWVEIDKHARKSYEAIHQPEGEWTAHDIASVSNDDIRLLGRERGPIDIICGGFPCQAFSVAGKRGGFGDTRGTLFFEIARFASILKPKYLFLENVKGLLSHDRGNTFETIIRTLDELGYDAEWQVLNSKDFGVPQHRERVFIIGHLRGERTRQVFPITGKSTKTDCEYAERKESRSFVIKKENRLIKRDIATCLDANYFKGLLCNQERTGVLEIRPVLTPDREKKRQNGRRMKESGEPMFTLTAQDIHGIAIKTESNRIAGWIEKEDRIFAYQGDKKRSTAQEHVYFKPNAQVDALTVGHTPKMIDGYRIRKLTPRECWRLQGFPDWAFDRAKAAGVSDTQLYKQAGNSVTVNVIYEIAKRL